MSANTAKSHGPWMPTYSSRDLPVRLSARGVRSFLKRGGLLMLYKTGCPYCDAVYKHGDRESTLAQVARHVHGGHDGDGPIVAVCDGPRHRDAMDAAVSSHIDTYPTFVSCTAGGPVTKYEGARTPKALRGTVRSHVQPVASAWELALQRKKDQPDPVPMSVWESGDVDRSFTARNIALSTGTRLVSTTAEADAFVRRNNGVLVLVSSREHEPAVRSLARHRLRQTGTQLPVAVGQTEVMLGGMTDELRDQHEANKTNGDPGFLVTLAGDSVIYEDTANKAISHLRDKGLLAA